MDIKTSKIELSESTAKSFASSSERFLGYFYSGLLLLALITIENSDVSLKIASAIGPVLTLMVFMALGVLIFTLYNKFIGEFFLYPFQHLVHVIADKLLKRSAREQSSTVGILHEMGVPWIRARCAYEFIKDFYFEDKEKKSIQHCHGELHVLYITAVLFISTFFVLMYFGKYSPTYLTTAMATLLAGFLLDTRQHIQEAFIIRNSYDEIRTFLLENNYISPSHS